MNQSFLYDVAFSFAGEDRKYVEEVALYLKKNNISVFYDYFEEEKLWGKNLISYLEEIYTHSSKYCVIFISQYYVQKEWTCYESTAAMVRLLNSNVKQKEYLLPVKFDETKVPGILRTIGTIDGNGKSPSELGNLIINKIQNNVSENSNLMSIEDLKHNLIKILSKDFPPFWSISYKETNHNIQFQYNYHHFIYFLEFEFDDKVLLLNGGYADIFSNSAVLVPAAKIILVYENKLIASGKIVNIDFFDSICISSFPMFEIIKKIKNELLKKGGC